MKLGFYPRLAWSGMKNNRRLFVPYILAAAGVAAVFYIMFYLAGSGVLDDMRGGSSTKATLSLGVFVIVLFALIFLFYCNSFLVRRRYKEFGLYSILGMNKHNIALVLAWETLFCALMSIAGGTFFGVLLSKLAELGLVRMIGGEPSYTLRIFAPALLYMVLYFGGIFVLVYISSLVKIRKSTAIDLVRSESYGEKPVKANPVLGIAGVVILAVAYYLAVSIEQPLQALFTFFVAVIMVIVGTYLVLIAGSVLLCKLLQKNKRYYYKPQHFVSVSSMAYRMKRNGAGLASICILATMVLVMISSTSCLYFGLEDSLNARYPRDIVTSAGFESSKTVNEDTMNEFRGLMETAIGDRPVSNVLEYRDFTFDAEIIGGRINTKVDTYSFNVSTYNTIASFQFVPLADYNKAAGAHEILSDGEILVYPTRCDIDFDTMSINDLAQYKVKKVLDEMPLVDGSLTASVLPSITVVVPDFDSLIAKLGTVENSFGGPLFQYVNWNYSFDTSLKGDEQNALYEDVRNVLREKSEEEAIYSYSTESLALNREDFYGSFGGLFFLGIMLSAVFICAAVLIIYYKQLSEGYEDAKRFEIMQKVGMTKQEIRRSINSQLLTVFFLPLIFAGLHLAFAFPFIRKILYMFSFYNTSFLVWTTVISFFVFAVLYALVYKKTSNTYYKIVSK